MLVEGATVGPAPERLGAKHEQEHLEPVLALLRRRREEVGFDALDIEQHREVDLQEIGEQRRRPLK